MAAFISYNQVKQSSSHPETFGHGEIEGVAASESANNGACGATMIPMLTLGVPGDGATAILMGAFMIHGMIPGPLMFEQNAQFIYAIYGSLIIANLFLLGVGRLGLRLFCKVVQIPSVILYPIIIFTCVMGAYLAQYAVFDVTLMLCFSLLAYFMRKFDYSFICLIIGFILAPIWETSLQQVIIASEQDPYMFLTRPVAVVLMLMTFFIIVKSVLAADMKK